VASGVTTMASRVAAQFQDRLAVDLDTEPRRAVAGAAGDDHVVEGDDRAGRVGPDRGHEGRALVDQRIAPSDAIQRRAEVVAVAVGQEAHVAEVDAEDSDLVGHRQLQRAQDRAVATERDDERAACAQSVRRGARPEVEDAHALLGCPRLHHEQLRPALSGRSHQHSHGVAANVRAEREPSHLIRQPCRCRGPRDDARRYDGRR
jgi:hypothetical protein